MLLGLQAYESYRDAAIAAGARAGRRAALSVEQALDRFGTVTSREVELLCDLPGPRAQRRAVAAGRAVEGEGREVRDRPPVEPRLAARLALFLAALALGLQHEALAVVALEVAEPAGDA